jgi:methyl-accepting chemotaxis protein
VNKAEADMVASIDASHEAYRASRQVVIVFAVGSIVLALVLGYAISWSVIGPVKRMDERLRGIASGDFSGRVMVPNRDELGALAANLNRMNEDGTSHQCHAVTRRRRVCAKIVRPWVRSSTGR